MGQVCRTDSNRLSAPSSLLFIRTVIRSLQGNPDSIQVVLFLVRIQVLGLSIPPAETRVHPGIFRPLIRPSRYHGSCISAMFIPLTFTVLERTLEAAIVCCRLASINEVLHSISFSLLLLFTPIFSLKIYARLLFTEPQRTGIPLHWSLP